MKRKQYTEWDSSNILWREGIQPDSMETKTGRCWEIINRCGKINGYQYIQQSWLQHPIELSSVLEIFCLHYPVWYPLYESIVYSNDLYIWQRLRALPLRTWYGNSISITLELVKNADPWPHPKPTESESAPFTVYWHRLYVFKLFIKFRHTYTPIKSSSQSS